MKRLSSKQQFLATMLFASEALSASMPPFDQPFQAIASWDIDRIRAVMWEKCLARKTPSERLFEIILSSGDSREKVQLLIARGADVNAKNKHGDTPLHVVIMNGCADMVPLLLDYGADVNEKNKDGDTPLYLAILYVHTEIAELLLARNPDVNVKNCNGNTALHLAAIRGCTEIAKLLLDHGADVNARNQDHNTPLHLAASRWGGGETVKLLLQYDGTQLRKRKKEIK